ncbi:MAG: type A chloramphenicol O-acetyltransferase [Verrucomicrobia bacterium]|nr:type A chloramphenicol O-acetyltransferase [Verrucomicrobiota bacterium]MBS0637989.1 type A chloramphenicol O-acetyltransferase [Verrucomicrobiota bacterium]
MHRLIDETTWPRKPYFDHYYHSVKCTYSVCIDIDITELLQKAKAASYKLYPCMLYIIARAVNKQPELRTNYDAEGRLGIWDIVDPGYTIFHDDDKTFSTLWTTYDEDFSRFHSSYLEDNRVYGSVKGFFPQGIEPPLNSFPVSCIPWLDFTGFNLNIYDDARYLSPIFTIGKYSQKEGKTVIPISCQLHHALVDGYHAGLLFEEIKSLAGKPQEWLMPST